MLRELNNFSQEEIAKYLGIGQTTYSRYENLKTYPDIFIIKKLADLYKISIDNLLDEVESEEVTITLTPEEVDVIQKLNKKIITNKLINSKNTTSITTGDIHNNFGGNINISNGSIKIKNDDKK